MKTIAILILVGAALSTAGCWKTAPPKAPLRPNYVQPAERPPLALGEGWYSLQKGDTLYSIALKYHTTVDGLLSLNPSITDTSTLAVGTVIRVPTSETPPAVTKPPAPPPGPKIISNLPVSAQGYVWPVDGRVMVRFGETLPGEPPTRSRGIDIVVGSGAEIRAARAGTAYVTLSSLPQFGNTIAIDHGNGVTTFYGYELVVQVQNGQQVQQGQVIALAASRASPRVHFRIRRDGGPVDPLPYLPAER